MSYFCCKIKVVISLDYNERSKTGLVLIPACPVFKRCQKSGRQFVQNPDGNSFHYKDSKAYKWVQILNKWARLDFGQMGPSGFWTMKIV